MGGAGEVHYLGKGKLNEKKIHARQLILKIFMSWPKKIHTRNLITKKKSCDSKIPLPPPPHNFSNGPSLRKRLRETTGGKFDSCSVQSISN